MKGEKADNKTVELYIRKTEGLSMGLNRVVWTKTSAEYYKNTLTSVTGKLAVSNFMAMVDGDKVNPTNDFPKNIKDFKLFF